MRSARLLFTAVLALLLSGTGATAWAGPPRGEGKRAPEVQPDPASPFAREARADVILARIGRSVAEVRRRVEAARASKDVVRLSCSNDKLARLTALEQKARQRRSDLRDAALDEPPASDAPWADLVAFEAEAKRLEAESQQCVGEELRAQEVVVMAQRDASPRKRAEAQGGADRGVSYHGGAPTGLLVGGNLDTLVYKPSPKLRAPAGPIALPQVGAPGPAAAPPAAGAPAASPFKREGAHDSSMLLRSAQLTLAVYEVEKKMDAVEAAAREAGGYLALRGDREISVRVPRERFDEALRGIEKLGDVLHKSVAAEDVTDQYVDLELRLRNAQAVRARLEKLLESATVRDAVEIHKELARVTEEIERLTGKLKLLRDRIAFSTITVTFERTEPQRVRSQQALLPFPWMRTMGLGPLLQVPR